MRPARKAPERVVPGVYGERRQRPRAGMKRRPNSRGIAQAGTRLRTALERRGRQRLRRRKVPPPRWFPKCGHRQTGRVPCCQGKACSPPPAAIRREPPCPRARPGPAPRHPARDPSACAAIARTAPLWSDPRRRSAAEDRPPEGRPPLAHRERSGRPSCRTRPPATLRDRAEPGWPAPRRNPESGRSPTGDPAQLDSAALHSARVATSTLGRETPASRQIAATSSIPSRRAATTKAALVVVKQSRV